MRPSNPILYTVDYKCSSDCIECENINGKTKIQNREGWKNLSAVKEQKIFPLDTNFITRPGSRIAESIEILLKIFHPEI